MKFQYKYSNVFFRRPVNTKENRRLFVSTISSTFILLVIVYFSMNWAVNFSSSKISQTIKDRYISFLENEVGIAGNSTVESPDSDIFSLADTEEISQPSSFAESVANITGDRQIQMEQYNSTEQPPGYFDYILKSDQPLVLGITAAVRAVPGIMMPEEYLGRREKKLKFDSDDQLVNRLKKPINIPVPDTVKLASDNGNRDFHQVLSVMEANEIDIRHCFEKYTRYDPFLSGDVKVTFSIHPDGYVIPASIKILKSQLNDPRIISCIKKTIQRWRNFPQIAYEDGNFKVTRKYIF